MIHDKCQICFCFCLLTFYSSKAGNTLLLVTVYELIKTTPKLNLLSVVEKC